MNAAGILIMFHFIQFIFLVPVFDRKQKIHAYLTMRMGLFTYITNEPM